MMIICSSMELVRYSSILDMVNYSSMGLTILFCSLSVQASGTEFECIDLLNYKQVALNFNQVVLSLYC